MAFRACVRVDRAIGLTTVRFLALGAPRPGPDRVQRRVCGRGVQPGRRVPRVGGVSRIEGDEDVLRHILGLVRVADDALRDTDHPGVLLPEDRLQGGRDGRNSRRVLRCLDGAHLFFLHSTARPLNVTRRSTARFSPVLVREEPATDLTIATRILSRAGALASDGRVTLRLYDVMYVA